MPQVTGASVRGAAHRRSDVPNQDAVAWLPPSGAGDLVVAAVADGHGSPKSFRSREGAARAVTVATEVLWSRFGGARQFGTSRSGESLRAGLHEIVSRWRDDISAHVDITPFSDEELATLDERAGEQAVRDVRHNPWLAYGTTLLTVVVTPTATLYAQLGDGDILAVSAHGRVRHPLPSDQRLVADETTSLCDARAAAEFRTLVEPRHRGPRLVLVSSDGYSNSFASDDAFRQVGSDLHSMIESDGIAAVSSRLEGWLTETTDSGAGDDVTLALILLPTRQQDLATSFAPSQALAPRTPTRTQRPPADRPSGRLLVRLDGHTHELHRGDTVTIGRGRDADIRTANPHVSSLHATVTTEAGRWVLVDAGSKAGLFHNGVRVMRAPVVESMSVWLGEPRSGERLDLLVDGREPRSERVRSLPPRTPEPRAPHRPQQPQIAVLASVGLVSLVVLVLLGVVLWPRGLAACAADLPASWTGQTVQAGPAGGNDGTTRSIVLGVMMSGEPLDRSSARRLIDENGDQNLVEIQQGDGYFVFRERIRDGAPAQRQCVVPGTKTYHRRSLTPQPRSPDRISPDTATSPV